MKNWLFFFAFFGLLLLQPACSTDTESQQQEGQSQSDQQAPPKEAAKLQWKIVAGKEVGQIKSTYSEADIIAAYGADQVSRKEYMVGEGETAPATVVFAGQKEELAIFWKPEQLYERIDRILIDHPESPWRTTQDVGIGTTMEQLVILNGKSFNFYGFEWDYAGRTNDWNGGFINKKLEVFLVPENPEAVYPHLLGDELYSSDNLKARAADLVVEVLVINF